MRNLFLTPGPIAWASSRYRAYWPSKYMSDTWVQTPQEYQGAPIEADNYIFIKLTVPDFIENLYNVGKKIVIDYCDPTWWFEPVKVRQSCDYAHRITFSNKELADDFTEWYGDGARVQVIPDRLELSHYARQRNHLHADPVRFIWFGAGQNRQAVAGGFAYLERLVKNGVNVTLTIMDDYPGESSIYDYSFPVYYVRWQLEFENSIIADHDIALLPPYPGPWGRVKSNNKHLTAWACGLPVTDGEKWEDLFTLAVSADARQIGAKLNYDLVKHSYDVRETANDYQSLLAGL